MKEIDFVSMAEVDIAYRVLADIGEPLYYKKLITNVIEKKRKSVQSMAVAISEIYTMINMDGRFQHRGEGKWGLTEWNPPEVKRSTSRGASKSSTSRASTKSATNRAKIENDQD